MVIAAGHTKADYDTIVAARAAGLTGFTHLFNAMPPLAGREPGPVGAALDDPDAWCGIIVDLHHVSVPSLRVAINARGWERMMLVTDAMPSVGSTLDHFELLGRTVTRKDGMLTTADGTLAGSDLDMASAVRNTVRHLGLPLEAALHMASRAPAEFLVWSRTAFSSIFSNTGSRSPGELEITCSTSEVAVCCSNASLRSLVRWRSSLSSRAFSMAMTA